MKNRAFTLIELLVVVLIIGILAAIALPQYQKAVMKSRLVQMQVHLDALRKAAEVYYLANNVYPAGVDALDIDITGSAAEIKQSHITNNTQNGAYFSDGTECTSTHHAVACLGDDFYLIRKHDHDSAPQTDSWPKGVGCQGQNTRAVEICRSMSKYPCTFPSVLVPSPLKRMPVAGGVFAK